MVKVKITDSFGIGYAAGKVYEVTEEEAIKLIAEKKAIPLTDMPKVETAEAKPVKKEVRKK